MAGESIYDVEYSQGIAMPSDALTENDYTQDVFLQTRPEVFDFDNRDKGESPSQGDPYFRDYDMDDSIKYQENSLDRYNHNPHNWDKQRNPLINPYERSDKQGSAFRVVEAHLKESATPKKKVIKPYDTNKPETLSGRSPTLAKLMHYTSSFSRKRAPNTSVSIIKADPENMTWTYRAKGREKWSDPSGHVVNIVLEKQEGMKDFREMKVKVNCDCNFWKFWGPDFNSGNGGRGLDPYRLGPSIIDKGVSPAPKIRDPGRHNFICKHVAAVGKIFQKYAAKHNLDTYKQVDGIFQELEKQEKADSPEKEMAGVKAIVEKMERSEQKEIQPLIDRYEKEENEYRKERMRASILGSLEDNIETKDKGWLEQILAFLSKFFKVTKGSNRNASVERVLEMYINEI
jgi:hypothetical protein